METSWKHKELSALQLHIWCNITVPPPQTTVGEAATSNIGTKWRRCADTNTQDTNHPSRQSITPHIGVKSSGCTQSGLIRIRSRINKAPDPVLNISVTSPTPACSLLVLSWMGQILPPTNLSYLNNQHPLVISSDLQSAPFKQSIALHMKSMSWCGGCSQRCVILIRQE